MSRLLLISSLPFAALAFACGTDVAPDDPMGIIPIGKGDDPKADDRFGFLNLPSLDTPPEIGFCPDIILEGDPVRGTPQTIVNQTNAHYLSYISGNAYADFVHFAPMMEELGFGLPGEGVRLDECGTDLVRVRAWESRRETCGSRGCRPNVSFDPMVDEEVLTAWGGCAAEWYRGRFGAGSDAPEGVDGMFEEELTATTHYGARLEFLTGGEFNVGSDQFEKGTTQLIWAEHNTLPLVVVAFRGTEFQDGAEDLWADLNVGKDPYYGWGEVHQGFLNALDSVMPLLNDKLAEVANTDRRIWVTGHSLGAALATLFTADMLRRKEMGSTEHNLIASYTFGSPRVGDEAFRARFEELTIEHGVSVWRFRNDRDVVARIPSAWRFDHVGGEAHFQGRNLTLTSMTSDAVPRGIISDLWEHHFMAAYYGEVTAWNDGAGPTSVGSLNVMRIDTEPVYNCYPTE